MAANLENISMEKEVTINQKLIGLIRLARPQFLFAYLIVGVGGLVVGTQQGLEIDTYVAVYSILAVLTSAIGVHYRDEAGDWVAGYDIEYGGMGVIREGTLSENTVRLLGRIISIITIILAIIQASYLFLSKNEPILLIIGVPILIMIVFVNYLTEEIPFGHEIITAGSYLATFYWIYLAQAWTITTPVIFFSIFIFLIVFALIPYQDIGDIEVDAKTGKKTLTRRLGIDGIGQLSIFIGLISFMFLYLAILS